MHNIYDQYFRNYFGFEDGCRVSHFEETLPFIPAGALGPLKGPGSSGVLDAIWCNLSLVLEHFCTKFMTNISEIILVLSMGVESVTLRKLCHLFRPGPRARLRALEAQGFYMLSGAI